MSSERTKLFKDTCEFLWLLGYTKTAKTSLELIEQEKNGDLLRISIKAILEKISNDIGQKNLPKRLYQHAVYLIAAEFLFLKNIRGDLTAQDKENIGNSAIRHIKEGDTDVSFGEEMTVDERFDSVLSYLRTSTTQERFRFRSLFDDFS